MVLLFHAFVPCTMCFLHGTSWVYQFLSTLCQNPAPLASCKSKRTAPLLAILGASVCLSAVRDSSTVCFLQEQKSRALAGDLSAVQAISPCKIHPGEYILPGDQRTKGDLCVLYSDPINNVIDCNNRYISPQQTYGDDHMNTGIAH